VLGLYLSRPERLPLAWRNQCTVLGFAFARSASLSHRPHPRRGTGIWPDRDIVACRRHMTAPRPSLPTAPPAPPRTPAAKARLFDVAGEYPARHGLSAGGKRIRTFGPAALQADPISAVCDHDFAKMPATFKMAVCLLRLGERECPIDHGAQAVHRDCPVHGLEIDPTSDADRTERNSAAG